jgi:hypothetical protein
MLIPITLDMRSTQKVMAGFIAKRNVEGMLVAFIDLTKTFGVLFIHHIHVAHLLRRPAEAVVICSNKFC